MTDAVARFIAAHAAATATEREYADAFVSTRWAITEISDALDAARRQVRAMQIGRITKSIALMVDAQRELDRLLAKSRQLSETIARVVEAHAKRGGGM